MKTFLSIVLLFLAVRISAQQLPTAYYRHHGKLALNDADVTPGAVNRSCLADRSGARHVVAGVEENMCAKDFRTGPIRKSIHNFAKLKRTACAAYGVKKCDASVEGDHLISIELCGCPDCSTNLWPQPMAEARIKDHQVENALPKLICAGKISLSEAQKCVASDWVECNERIVRLK